MTKTIYFDMDGTIADLYSVSDWLPYLREEKTKPYSMAKPLVNMRQLARTLNKLQNNGYRIGIISWGSMKSTPEYLQATEKAKKRWLARHLGSVKFNEIHILPYGFDKETLCREGDILFDDNKKIRDKWNTRGNAYPESAIFDVLTELIA